MPRNEQPASYDSDAAGVSVVPVKQPSVDQLASAQTRRSWYIEQRDRPTTEVSSESRSDVPVILASKDGSYAPGSTRTEMDSSTMLSRPQPVGRPQQTVLEWSHQPSPVANRSFTTGLPTRVVVPQPAIRYNATVIPLSTGSS